MTRIIAYGLLGLGLTYLAASGVTIWLARRRDKGRAAPGWERVWTAVVWGQPVALVAAAGVVLAESGATMSLALTIWAAVTAAALVAAALVPAPLLARAGKLSTAILLVALALGHALVRGGGDPIAWTVNAALAAIGLILFWFVRRTSPAAA